MTEENIVIISPAKKEKYMAGVKMPLKSVSQAAIDRSALRTRLIEHLANSLSTPLPTATERRLFGRTIFPGKATAVI